MACFSDRFVSLNKIIIAAAIAYAGAVSLAHAGAVNPPDSPHLGMPACSAKFVDQWNNWNGEKGAFAMPKTTCFLDEGNQVSLQVCGPKGCGAMPYVLENKELDEQILVVLHILPACSAKFISFARMARDAKAADFPAKTCVMPGRLPTEGPGRFPTEGFYVCSKSDGGCSAIRDWIDANSHGNTEVVGP